MTTHLIGHPLLEKVTAFILDEDDPRRLLVIEHPDGGRQLIGGTVELGESPQEALYRECVEETGLHVHAPSVLWVEQSLCEGKQRVLCVDAAQASEGILLRGHTVLVEAVQNGLARVCEVEYDLSVVPPAPVRFYRSHVPVEHLCDRVTRHFYLCFAKKSSLAWEHIDEGRVLRLVWVDMKAELGLTGRHRTWLEQGKRQLDEIE